MTSRELFKLGFYLKCASSGIKPQEADKALLEKRAFGESLGTLAGAALAGAIAIPPVLGYSLGALASKGMSTDIDEKAIQSQELIEEYKRLAKRARLQAKLKRLQEQGALM
jgi:hypothetical protein